MGRQYVMLVDGITCPEEIFFWSQESSDESCRELYLRGFGDQSGIPLILTRTVFLFAASSHPAGATRLLTDGEEFFICFNGGGLETIPS